MVNKQHSTYRQHLASYWLTFWPQSIQDSLHTPNTLLIVDPCIISWELPFILASAVILATIRNRKFSTDFGFTTISY